MRTTVVGILLAIALAGCYPTACDPTKDPSRCQCPDGACGDYPRLADAGRD